MVRVRQTDDCWLWTTNHNPKGYGLFKDDDRRQRLAHRVAYEMFVAPIPDGLHVCHRCDVPACVRPDHLFVGTNADNMADKTAKGRGTPPPRFLGPDHPNAKLTADKARQIRARRAAGEGYQSIADAFGVSTGAVSGIVMGRTWRHV